MKNTQSKKSKLKKLSNTLLPVFFVVLLLGLGTYFAFSQLGGFSVDLSENREEAGLEKKIFDDFLSLPVQAVEKTDEGYEIIDDKQGGPKITYAKDTDKGEKTDKTEENSEEKKETPEDKFSLSFNNDYSQGIEIELDSERRVLLLDNNNNFSKSEIKELATPENKNEIAEEQKDSFWQKIKNLFASEEVAEKYIQYEDKSGRKKMYYAYQKDGARGERKLKNWLIYEYGDGQEKESYTLKGAKIEKNQDGEIEVYYWGEQEEQNEMAQAEVDDDLLAHAQRVLEKELGPGAMSGQKNPDFIIPKPFYIDKNGKQIELDWNIDMENSSFSLDFQVEANTYPIALDPTLEFTAPGINTGADVITGEYANNEFGISFTTGDFNNDGQTDLAVGARGYNSITGRAYIFYNDGSYPSAAASADVIITGEGTDNYFGATLTSGDFNADGKTDLAVGAYGFNSSTGRVYIFYNDGSYPSAAASADVIITGEATSDYFGSSLTSGDFNSDGQTDLVVGAYRYNSDTGRAYIFYNDSSYPSAAASADVIITGEATSNYFGAILTSGDFNADGKTDLAVEAWGYNSYTGRVYIFYNDGSYPSAAASADVIITGEATFNYFGFSLTSGDFNADGKTDLAVGSYGYNSYTGRAYIFYNDGNYPSAATSADVIITGEATFNYFGLSLTSGDFNADGKTDLAVGAWGYNSNTGRAYIFYNDGNYPSAATSADVTITGEATSNYFGHTLTSGDFNADGKTDLAVGAHAYNSDTGRAYIFYNQNGVMNTNAHIDGEAGAGDYFGEAMISGDFNADGKTDLAFGTGDYNSWVGRAYIFYNDGSYPSSATTADVIITSEATSGGFGGSLTSGDFNGDGTTDIAVGAPGYNINTGAVYIFYNDGAYPSTASSADAIITGAADYRFGISLLSGDFNADGQNDLAVANRDFNESTGQVLMFYNDGSYPVSAASADVTISGEGGFDYFGDSFASGDFNSDGKTDLAVGAFGYDPGDFTSIGRVYIFYNDGSYPSAATSADEIITGEGANSNFGYSVASGDFNADAKTDLAVVGSGYVYIFYNDGTYPSAATSADEIIATSDWGGPLLRGDFNSDGKADLALGTPSYNSNTGRVYIFYNDGTYPSSATSADVIITGEGEGDSFGEAMIGGDFNSDGKTDLIVGAPGYNTNTGRVYFYEASDGYVWDLQPQVKSPRILPGVGQEIKTTGEEAGDNFGTSMISGDFNFDGKTDLAVGASGYNSSIGRVYIFYNNGNYPSAAASADSIINGEDVNSNFGNQLFSGDFNNDGKVDLVIGANGYNLDTGRIYIFYNNGNYPSLASLADEIITGESAGDNFGQSIFTADLNFNGKTDLVVGASYFNQNAGRIYIFYNDGNYPSLASSADETITGEGAGDFFGFSISSGDFNDDGKVDLSVGSPLYNSNTGRVYIFYNDGNYSFEASSSDVIITGEGTDDYFGYSLSSGDFNNDGKTDLVVGANRYNAYTGRVYVFYNSSYPANASSADTVITGNQFGDELGYCFSVGDFNYDGITDLAICSQGHNFYTGQVYIFYNDGSFPSSAALADVTVAAENESNYFGKSLTNGDFNSDGKTDLAVGAYGYNSNTGRMYIYTLNDKTITGEETSNYFGYSLTTGDFNADGKTDLAVGAAGYNSYTGRAYIFYNDGTYPSTATSADLTITGEATSNYFGRSLTSGDFNADGKTDLAVGAYGYNSATGRAYIFYNDGTYPSTATSADITITGEAASNYFGYSLTFGDFNADGQTDLTVGALAYNSNTGRAYIFYNDGSYPPTAASADVTITGEATSNSFGATLTSGDFNADGQTDLAVGAYGYNSITGRAYIFYNDGNYPSAATSADVTITGEATSNSFGATLTSGDFNADGRADLAVGASRYNSNTGRAYIFYNDGSYPSAAASADVIITGEATFNYFGDSLSSGDFNADGKTDLAVGAYGYNSNAGRAYIFYNDGAYPAFSFSADIVMTGETSSNGFGYSLASSDFNNDGQTDLAVGAYGYNSSTGRVYTYITEVKKQDKVKAKIRGTGSFRGDVRFR